MLFIFAICGPFLLLLSQRCLSKLSYLSSLSYYAPFSIYHSEVKLLKYIIIITWNCYKYIMTNLWNIKLCKELCPPTESYKRTGVPSTARDSLRFALSSMNLSRWLLLPSKSLQVEKNVVIKLPSKCVFSLGLHSYHRAVFLLTKLLQQVLTDISRLLRPTCSSGSSTLSTPTRALWLVPVIWASVAKTDQFFVLFFWSQHTGSITAIYTI